MRGDLIDAVIVDLDGTLADVIPVRHLVAKRPGGKRNFEAFHRYACTEADPIEATVASVRRHHAEGTMVLLVSGRLAKWRDLTKTWLATHEVHWHWLFMRADGDYRPDTVVKREMFEQHIAGRYRVVHAYDDRPEIVALWESLGISVTVVPGWQDEQVAPC